MDKDNRWHSLSAGALWGVQFSTCWDLKSSLARRQEESLWRTYSPVEQKGKLIISINQPLGEAGIRESFLINGSWKKNTNWPGREEWEYSRKRKSHKRTQGRARSMCSGVCFLNCNWGEGGPKCEQGVWQARPDTSKAASWKASIPWSLTWFYVMGNREPLGSSEWGSDTVSSAGSHSLSRWQSTKVQPQHSESASLTRAGKLLAVSSIVIQ